MPPRAPAAPPNPEDFNDEAIVRFLAGLWQLNRRMKQDVEPLLTRYGLDLRRFFLLIAVRKGTVYPKELSESLQVPATLLSRYIDALVQPGYLERQIDPQDSRRTRLTLTPLGLETIKNAVADIKTYTSQRLRGIEPDKLLAMLDALEDLGYPHEVQAAPQPVSPPAQATSQENL